MHSHPALTAANILMRFGGPEPEEVEAVLDQLKSPPRKLHANLSQSIKVRAFFLLIISSAFFTSLGYGLLQLFWATDNDYYWIVLLGVAVPLYIFVVYTIGMSAYKRLQCFLRGKHLYERGKATLGTINTLTVYSRDGYQNFYIPRRNIRSSSNELLRIDYQFEIDDKQWVGSNKLRYRHARKLFINAPVVVLYDEKSPGENMIFPVPLAEMKYQFFDEI